MQSVICGLAHRYADKKSQADKKCQITNMWPVKPQMDVRSKKPAMKSSINKSIGLNKNCKATVSCKKQKKYQYDDFQSQSTKWSNKNCHKKGNINMWSVTNNTNMQLPKPAIRRLCKDKNSLSTRCYKCPVRPMNSYDKNCQ